MTEQTLKRSVTWRQDSHRIVVSAMSVDYPTFSRIVVTDEETGLYVAEIVVSDIGGLSVDGDLLGGTAYLSGTGAAKLEVADERAYARFTGRRIAFGLSRHTAEESEIAREESGQ